MTSEGLDLCSNLGDMWQCLHGPSAAVPQWKDPFAQEPAPTPAAIPAYRQSDTTYTTCLTACMPVRYLYTSHALCIASIACNALIYTAYFMVALGIGIL